jgi:hypothetical protein
VYKSCESRAGRTKHYTETNGGAELKQSRPELGSSTSTEEAENLNGYQIQRQV